MNIKKYLLDIFKSTNGLVLVERMVTKRGKTFRQRFWVKPKESPKTKSTPKTEELILSPKVSQNTKDKATQYASQFSSKQDFLDKLKSLGITWKPTNDPRIEWMRAKVALCKAMENGFTPPITSNTNSTTTPKPTQIKTSETSKEKAHTFYTSCKDKQDFYKKLETLGIKWKATTDPKINFMRAKVALGKAIESGFTFPTTTSTKPVVQEDYTSQICKVLGRKHYDAIIDMLKSAKDTEVATLFGNYFNKMKVAIDPKRKVFSLDINSNSLRFDNPDSLAVASNSQKPYSGFFHEGGHFIDFNSLDYDSSNTIASLEHQNKLFRKTLQKEIQQVLDSAGITDLSDSFAGNKAKLVAYLGLKNGVTPLADVTDISDMIDAYTKGKLSLGIGHNKTYWKSKYVLKSSTEAFAEMTSATLSNPNSLQIIQKFLPNSYKVYKDIVKSLLSKPVTIRSV